MPSGRPNNCRRVACEPNVTLFKPCGVPRWKISEIVLTVDEFEALRLADYDCLHQAQAATEMGISRATFGRIIETARHKVIEALYRGNALRIEGGAYEVVMQRVFKCADCGHRWESSVGRCHTPGCPKCGSKQFGCDHTHETADDPASEGCCGSRGEQHSHDKECC